MHRLREVARNNSLPGTYRTVIVVSKREEYLERMLFSFFVGTCKVSTTLVGTLHIPILVIYRKMYIVTLQWSSCLYHVQYFVRIMSKPHSNPPAAPHPWKQKPTCHDQRQWVPASSFRIRIKTTTMVNFDGNPFSSTFITFLQMQFVKRYSSRKRWPLSSPRIWG